jgi:hypothetical protein
MKISKYILLVVLFLFSIFLYSQDKKKYYLEIPNTENVPVVVNENNKIKLQFSNNIINETFSKFEIDNFELAFPGGKGPILEIVYIIECELKLMETISNELNSYFGRWEEVLPIKLLYIPNDYGGLNGIVPPDDFSPIFANSLIAQPELDFIKAPQAWDISKGDGVFLGNAEGAFSDQEELTGKIINLGNSATYFTHGTQVAVAAAGNTDNNAGIASSGFNSKIITLGNGMSSLIPLANAGARAINMSWYYNCSNSLNDTPPIQDIYNQAIVNQVYNMGVVVIAAAGNGTSCGGNVTSYHYPAALDKVISVASIGHKYEQNDTTIGHENRKDIFRSWHSPPYSTTYHGDIDLTAPGYHIVTAFDNLGGGVSINQYQINHGTSIAAPITMGVVGLMFGANKCLFPDEVESILKLTAVKNDHLPLNLPYQGKIGAGRINSYEAVNMSYEMIKEYGTVEVINRIIDRWNFNLRTAPYQIKMINNIVTNNATLNFTARNNIDVLSGDYKPTITGFVDLKINPILNICNTPILQDRIDVKENKKISKKVDNFNNQVSLYPNPNNGEFIVKINSKFENNININIYNIQGVHVYSSVESSSEFQINISNLPDGIYLIRISDNSNFNENLRFIKN